MFYRRVVILMFRKSTTCPPIKKQHRQTAFGWNRFFFCTRTARPANRLTQKKKNNIRLILFETILLNPSSGHVRLTKFILKLIKTFFFYIVNLGPSTPWQLNQIGNDNC